MTEETFLQCLAVAAVEMREVRVAMHLKPLLFGPGSQPAFKIAAWMQTHAAPISGREQRGFNLLEFSGSRCVVIVKQLAAFRFTRRVRAIFGQFILRKRRRPSDPFSRHDAFCTARADAMLHACHLTRVPAVEKVAENASVSAQLAIIIG